MAKTALFLLPKTNEDLKEVEAIIEARRQELEEGVFYFVSV